MTTACDLPIDLSTKSQHHHHGHHHHHLHGHHHHHHHPYLAAQVQLGHEQLRQLQLEYLSHQQLSVALANHTHHNYHHHRPLNSSISQHQRHHLDQLELLERLQLASSSSNDPHHHQHHHHQQQQHVSSFLSSQASREPPASQPDHVNQLHLHHQQQHVHSQGPALGAASLLSPPSTHNNHHLAPHLSQQQQHHDQVQLAQQLAHHQHIQQQLQLAAAVAASERQNSATASLQQLQSHHQHLQHQHDPHHFQLQLHHHHHHHPQLHHLQDLSQLNGPRTGICAAASLASSSLSSASSSSSSSSSSSASSVSSSSSSHSNEPTTSPTIGEEEPLDCAKGHDPIKQLEQPQPQHQQPIGHQHMQSEQASDSSPATSQLSEPLSLHQMVVHGSGIEAPPGDNPSPIDLHRSSTSSTVSTISSPSSSSASITSTSSSLNLQHLNDKKRINRPLTDELIRQATVGCIEQGLLLFRIRNELRMTINYYRQIYESGIRFGLNKAIEAEIKISDARSKIDQHSETTGEHCNQKMIKLVQQSNVDQMNQLDSVNRIKDYYQGELSKREHIITEQRNIIESLTRKITQSVKSSI